MIAALLSRCDEDRIYRGAIGNIFLTTKTLKDISGRLHGKLNFKEGKTEKGLELFRIQEWLAQTEITRAQTKIKATKNGEKCFISTPTLGEVIG